MTFGGENSSVSEELHIIFNTIVFNQVIIWSGKEEEEVEKTEKEDKEAGEKKKTEKRKKLQYWLKNDSGIFYTSFNSYRVAWAVF